ncbi:DUF3325 domain-containing protein [Pseudomonas putida]|uniref:DUF3325 domain-containing protein n=1 Tax=Pseudomonas putida TaxID=303 RepID=A0A1Q9RB31_PSEPU|nr:hypothetical protein PSEMO_03780 [Pseudomonas putida]
MGVMLSTVLLLAYSGMLGLCLGLERHYKQVWQRVPGPWVRRGLRLGGWLALAASFAASVACWGWAMGPIGWLGLLSLAGLGWVMVLPYRAKGAVVLALVGWLAIGVVRLL